MTIQGYFLMIFSVVIVINTASADTMNLSDIPLSLGGDVPPNVMMMLDISGSMDRPMYEPTYRFEVHRLSNPKHPRTEYSSEVSYSGIFESNKRYKYDAAIAINTAAYGNLSSKIESDVAGAFYGASPCNSTGCWSGNFLNWLTARRIDAARMALIGGKLESRTASTIYGNKGDYKIVAQSGPDTTPFEGKYSDSNSVSPIPNNTIVTIFSPAWADADGDIGVRGPNPIPIYTENSTSLDPYSKIKWINGVGQLEQHNLALVVRGEPTGLIHDISSTVKMGLSLYKYTTTPTPSIPSIYKGANVPAGSMQFNIPQNPFVRVPSSYDMVEGYIGTSLGNLVRAIEDHPLLRGRTPLAQNLWEVIQYFEQDLPSYPANGGVVSFVTASNDRPELDPYYSASAEALLSCTKSTVVIITDGQPVADGVISSYGFTQQQATYDGDDNSHDGVASAAGNALDDIAYWGNCRDRGVGDGESCSQRGSNKAIRDLRPDLDGEQYLVTSVIAFAGDQISQVIQDAADNGGGEAHAASGAQELETALKESLQGLNNRGGTESSISITSAGTSDGKQVFIPSFESENWTGNLQAITIDQTDGSFDEVVWNADSLIPSWGQRNIITYNGTKGVPFRWGQDKLTDKQRALLRNHHPILQYLRGRTDLGPNFRRRPDAALGDIIHSSPTYMARPILRYPDRWGDSAVENAVPYSRFKAEQKDRRAIVYVGGNDGMLHAFYADEQTDSNNLNRDAGEEAFAYIPKAVFTHLAELSDPDYHHKYYVDGTPTIVDAFWDNEWHSVLVSGLGAGGQGIFALDITDPTASGEREYSTKVLWEYSDDISDTLVTNITQRVEDADVATTEWESDPSNIDLKQAVEDATQAIIDAANNPGTRNDIDMGYTFSQPRVVRLNNGRWAAVFGNGYNNTFNNDGDNTARDSLTGNAVFYIVDIETGEMIKKFDTQIGSLDDPSGRGKPNGVSTTTVIDQNGDSIADAIYAGDLFGNIWKIDIGGSSESSWDFAYGMESGRAKPLYTACTADDCSITDLGVNTTDNHQATTSTLTVIPHPEGGFFILFGTGKYVEREDKSDTSQATQTFYGIWDKSTFSEFDRSDLVQQNILLEAEVVRESPTGERVSTEVRITSNNPVDNTGNHVAINWETHRGWYLDLINTGNSGTNNLGERQISEAIIAKRGQIIFNTFLPQQDPCAADAGDGWRHFLDIYTGSRLSFSPLDLDLNNHFTSDDLLSLLNSNNIAVSAKRIRGGYSSPAVANVGNKTYIFNGDGTADLVNTGIIPGVQSWRQIQH